MIKTWFVLAVSGFVLLISYQNCADVRLSKVQESITSSAKIAGDVCSKTAEFKDVDLNFIFVVDMSESNIQANSDVPGARFDLINAFLTPTQGDQESCFKEGTRAAVIGFAGGVIGGTRSNICRSTRFKGAEGANQDIDTLRGIHNDLLDDLREGRPTDASLNATRYDEATSCISDMITEDVAQEDSRKKIYSVFFLTDGEPTDQTGATWGIQMGQLNRAALDVQVGNLSAQIEGLKDAIKGRALGLSLQPIFYGGLSSPITDGDPREAQKEVARTVLEKMAELGGSLVRTTQQVANVNLCGLAKAGSNERYKLKRFGIANLTARAKGAFLLADSDMDGIVDEEEQVLGFDPQRARSQYNVLDSICQKGICQSIDRTRDCGALNSMGLSRCDVEKLNLSDGLDQDRDHLPDFLEILKGTDPVSINDNQSNSDNDSLLNFREVLQGSDPNSYNDSYRADLILNYSVQKLATSFDSCPSPQESWSYSVDHIPLVETLATKNTDIATAAMAHLNHLENENVILIFYVVTKELETGGEEQYLYGKFVKIHISGIRTYEEQSFRLLGTIGSEFTTEIQ